MTTPTPSQAALLRRLANTLLLLVATLLFVWVVFAFLYWWVEDYRLIQAFHWSMQTLSTTGYGDVSPQTDGGIILAMLLQPQALLLTALFFANFVSKAIEDPNAFTHEEQEEFRTTTTDTNVKVTRILTHVEKENM